MKNARQRRNDDQISFASAIPARSIDTTECALPGSSPSTARHVDVETHGSRASATSAVAAMRPTEQLPASSTTARLTAHETHGRVASAASTVEKVKPGAALSRPSKRGRHTSNETQATRATPTPAIGGVKSTTDLPGSHSATVEAIRAHHRERRFAMGIQQVLDRKLESFIRINKTDWHVDDDEATRAKANREVAALIAAARKGEGDPSIIKVVQMTDDARAPADAERARHEREMETLARSLPVAPWIETVPGLGYLGLATIIAETGDLSLYPNVAKVWKRLGFAPYNGRAGSTWKRPTWHKGDPALTADEWIANPFSGRRYSLIHVIAVWLLNKQWIGAAKTDDGVGRPNGHYGEVYARRQAHTATTHPDWSKMHARMDGLRIMMKEVLKDLWCEWHRAESNTARQFKGEIQRNPASAPLAGSRVQTDETLPGSHITENARQEGSEIPLQNASGAPADYGSQPGARVPAPPVDENRSP